MPESYIAHSVLASHSHSSSDPTAVSNSCASLFEGITNQAGVRDFFVRVATSRRFSHAYLFVGNAERDMHAAAHALACSMLCPNGGDGTCPECLLVKRFIHPDLHWYVPAGSQEYLRSQISEIRSDCVLAPIRSHKKLYVLTHAEFLSHITSNEFLKTLEEPPAGVHFILMARTLDSVLPTIASRCQVVPFRTQSPALFSARFDEPFLSSDSPSPLEVSSPLDSPSPLGKQRSSVRDMVLAVMEELSSDDAWETLTCAQRVYNACRVPDDVTQEKHDSVEQYKDFFDAHTKREFESAIKRELSARERSSIMEVLSVTESLLRDLLFICEGSCDIIDNIDVTGALDRLAGSTTDTAVLDALEACSIAADNLARNVAPQLLLEVMFLSIKEALTCQPSLR